MIWNDLKRTETTYNEQDTTWNDRQDMKQPTTSKKRSTTSWTYLQRVKKWREATNNDQILRSFYSIGQSVLLSNTFSNQQFIAVIRALLHGESWWKKNTINLFIIMWIFIIGYSICRIRRETLWHSKINICETKVNLMNSIWYKNEILT